ncbi:MAG: RHS repeat-associated protein [Saprospiraceae bacterium]|jgi:RHS repeat-associated protein
MGNKLRKITSDGTKTDYVNGIEYKDEALESVYHSEGRATPSLENPGQTVFEYSIKDHLGNSRIMFSDLNEDGKLTIGGEDSEILQEEHYYPFGMHMEGNWVPQVGVKNKYLYNGKELNSDFGLDWLDYGARWYDPSIGRWGQIDPMAEKYYALSPYNYVANNPIKLIDPFGMDIYDKNGVKADISYDKDKITINNVGDLDAALVEVLVGTALESKTGFKTIKSLDKKGEKHQVISSDKVGVFQNEAGQFGRVVGLTERDVDGYDSRVTLFDTSDGFDIDSASPDDFELFLNDGSKPNSDQKSSLLPGIRDNFAGKKTHKSTQVALTGFSKKENKVFNEIIKTMRADPRFGRINTLIHEAVHAKGNSSETAAYRKEIKSFLQSDRNE